MGLEIVRVKTLVPPTPIVAGANALVMEGLACTVKLTGPDPVPPLICVVVTALTVFGFGPIVVLVT